MAITRVQAAPKGTGNPNNITFTTPPAVGSGIIVSIIAWNGTIGAAACTDNRGNSYTRAITVANGAPQVGIYYCPRVLTTGAPFTITFTGAGSYATAIEVSGLAAGEMLAVDRTATSTGTSATPSTGTTAALTGADDLAVIVLSHNTSLSSLVVETVSPPWVQDVEDLTGGYATGESDSRSLTALAGTTQSGSWVCSASSQWAAAIAVFTIAAYVAPTITVQLAQLPIEIATLSDATTPARLAQLPLEVLVLDVPPPPEIVVQLAQLPLEVPILSDAPIEIKIAQLSLELLLREPGWRLLVDDVRQTAHVVACSMHWTLNERARATVTFNDFLPERLAQIDIYARDGITKLFGGVILSRHVRGWTQAQPDLEVTCECVDYLAYADWVTVSAAYAASTLKAVLTALVTDYLSAYGITLDDDQVDGPAIAAVSWNGKRVSDALRELSDQTGYFLTISPDKALLMAPPGGVDAPYDWTEIVPTHVQEVEWRDLETVPANKIVLTCGPNGFATIADEHHWGDGSTRIFPLNSPYDAIVGALRTGSDSGGLDPGGFPVGIYGHDDMPWTFDAEINSLRQRADQSVLAADQYIMLWYQASFPFTVEATTGETPVIEYHEARPELVSIPAAQQIADALLAKMSGDPLTMHGRFDEDGYKVGQLLTVALADMRQIAGPFTIRTISVDLVLKDYWQYTLEATEGEIAVASYLEGWRKIMGEGYAIPGPWGSSEGEPPGGGGSSGGTIAAHASTHQPGGTDEIADAAWVTLSNTFEGDQTVDGDLFVTGTVNPLTADQRDRINQLIGDPTGSRMLMSSSYVSGLSLRHDEDAALGRIACGNYDAQTYQPLVIESQEFQIKTGLTPPGLIEQVRVHPSGGVTVGDHSVDPGGGIVKAQAFAERGRSVPLGEWQNVPFSAANFSGGNGLIWTMTLFDIYNSRYTVIGKTAFWVFFSIGSTLSGTAASPLVLTPPLMPLYVHQPVRIARASVNSVPLEMDIYAHDATRFQMQRTDEGAIPLGTFRLEFQLFYEIA